MVSIVIYYTVVRRIILRLKAALSTSKGCHRGINPCEISAMKVREGKGRERIEHIMPARDAKL